MAYEARLLSQPSGFQVLLDSVSLNSPTIPTCHKSAVNPYKTGTLSHLSHDKLVTIVKIPSSPVQAQSLTPPRSSFIGSVSGSPIRRQRRISDSIKRKIGGFTGLRNELSYRGHRFVVNSLTLLGLGHLLLGEPFSADQERDASTNFKLLHPAETLDFRAPGQPYTADPFLRSCQFIVEGRLHRGNIFTCEFSSAKFSPEDGLVYDARWRNIVESILDHVRFYTFRKTFRPSTLTRRSGVFSSVQHPWHNNNWHWTADSLSQVLSLALHMEGRPLTLLMSREISRVHRDSLEAILPENFTLEYVDPREWFELETFVLPSHVSARANAFFPPEYYEFIRSKTFCKLGIPKPEQASGRYYISRGRAKHRHVLNEPELLALIEPFGFKMVFIEDYTFAQQVELFRGTEAIISPHGAGLGGIIYGDHLKVCVLYPEARPAGYFYTLARGLGHQHFCTNANVEEHDDFEVNLTHLQQVLTEEMRLTQTA
jgi:hypothetical protein